MFGVQMRCFRFVVVEFWLWVPVGAYVEISGFWLWVPVGAYVGIGEGGDDCGR